MARSSCTVASRILQRDQRGQLRGAEVAVGEPCMQHGHLALVDVVSARLSGHALEVLGLALVLFYGRVLHLRRSHAVAPSSAQSPRSQSLGRSVATVVYAVAYLDEVDGKEQSTREAVERQPGIL